MSNILLNAAGTKVAITSTTGSRSVTRSTLSAIAGATTIRFSGEGLPALVIPYSDLQVNGVQVVGQSDAKVKLQAYIPEIIIVTSVSTDVAPKRFCGVHLVMSLFHLDYSGSSVTAYVQMLKDCGINVIWAHCDDYDPANPYYKTNVLAVCAACASIGGIWCAPGLLAFADTGANTFTKKMKDLVTDTFYLDGMFKLEGRQVYMQYGWLPAAGGGGLTYNEIDMQNLHLSAEGIHKKQYMLIIHVLYSYTYDNRATWQGEVSFANGLKNWSRRGFYSVKDGIPPAYTITDIDHELTQWNTNAGVGIDGTVNFSVDSPLNTNIADNLHKTKQVKAWKLPGGHWWAWAGFYASFSAWDYDFIGMEQSFDAMLALKIEERPIGLMAITGNDDVEYSRCTPLPGFLFGLKYIPSPGTFITTIPSPVLDRRGMIDYMKPRIDAFLNDKAAPVYYTNKIFCWYMLHPRGAAFISTIPSGMTDLGYTQSQWNTMLYKIGNGTVTLLKALAGVDDIRIGAHIIQPCYLKINSTLSTLFTPPVGGMSATFRIPIGSFTGIPVFSIIAADGVTVIKTGSGLQAISTSCWPGGWGILCVEV